MSSFRIQRSVCRWSLRLAALVWIVGWASATSMAVTQSKTAVDRPDAVLTSPDWTHWGGPQGDFTVEGAKLAEQWPDDGPAQLWNRPLGEGYSSIVVAGGRLYTMLRNEDSESVVALDAKTGETIWTHQYDATYSRAMRQYGPGPHATPYVTEKAVITIGVNLVIHALEIETGKVLWKHDLVKEFGAKVPYRGYAPSPAVDGDTVIFATDMPAQINGTQEPKEGVNHALVAFRISDGKLLWTGLQGVTAYSSPVVKELAGVRQVVLLMRKYVAGVDPANGKELWRVPVIEGHNVATPLCRNNLVFVTAAYETGGKLIRISKNGDTKGIQAEEQWYSREFRFDQGNAVWMDDCLYATAGDSGRAFFTCVDVRTGKSLWRERGFRRATLIQADQKVIMLQEDGTLQLLRVSSEGPKVISTHKIEVEKRPMWTPPTLVGSTLFVRNRTHLMAFDLGGETR